MDLFANDPLALLAGAVMIDLLWGNNEDHNLNFFDKVSMACGVECRVPLLDINLIQDAADGTRGGTLRIGVTGGSSPCFVSSSWASVSRAAAKVSTSRPNPARIAAREARDVSTICPERSR